MQGIVGRQRHGQRLGDLLDVHAATQLLYATCGALHAPVLAAATGSTNRLPSGRSSATALKPVARPRVRLFRAAS